MAKQPELEHVKFVPAKGKVYAYFNTGQKKLNGAPIYAPLPPFGSVGFYDSYAAMLAARSKRSVATYTVADMARDYERSKTFGEKAKGTQILYAKTLKRIVELLGDLPATDLQRGDLALVLENDMTGPAAHNTFLAVLGNVFKWGRSNDKTTLKPTADFGRRETGEHEPWPEEVLNAGLVAEDDRIRLLVNMLYFTGQRAGDVAAMRWKNIEQGSVLHIVQEKTGKEMWIPLLSELKAELDRTPKRGLFIALSDRGRPMSEQSIRRELQPFTEKLGFKTVPHGLRKNAVNAFLEASCSVPEVASITGQTYAIVEHYAKRINQKRMAESAVIKLENKRGSGKPSGKSDA